MKEKNNITEGGGEQQLRLDYTITDPQERNKIVHKIIEKTPPEKLNPYYLEELTKYLVQDFSTKKDKTILTDNRMVTINKRETSFEGLVSKLQAGEDGIYNFIADNDKNILFVPKIEITEKDIETIPGLKELREEIKKIQIQQKKAVGKQKFLLTKQLIQMRQDQYVLKSLFNPPITITKMTKGLNQILLDENIVINSNTLQPQSDCLISFFNPEHICAILCNYSKLKEQCWGHFENDMYYLMEDFDTLADHALKDKYPILYDIMIYKIDGILNKQILKKIKNKYNITYSIEYLSVLWRKKIPKIISQQAKEDWITWYYSSRKKGKWKKCSKCHQIKLAHPYFFARNNTSKDGWYSICKCCRNKK